MPRILTLFLLCFFGLTFSAAAQSDSLQVVKAQWKVQRIAPGVKWKQFWFNQSLFNSNQNINILEIKPKRKIWLDLGYEPKELKPTSSFGRSSGALAALNGTFFDIKYGGSIDFIRSDSRIINESRLGKSRTRAPHQRSALLFINGKLEIVKWDGSPDWENKLTGEDIMVSGPLLVLNKRPEVIDSSAFNRTRHPRTAVAITNKNRILFLTVDGRQEQAAGMSLFELRNVLRWLNTRDGINLDGGGSTTLWIQGQPENGIVNYPSDNKKWDRAGERKVANVVLVKRRKK
jgi:exopolysaccharide biosynthesis protein